MLRRLDHSEEQLQRTVVEHWRIRGVPGSILAAIPNGERRDKATGARLRAQGVLSGFPDLFALGVSNMALGAFLGPPMALIELKRPTAKPRDAEKDLSDAQKEIIPLLRAGGINVLVSNRLDEVLCFLENLGVLKPATSITHD